MKIAHIRERGAPAGAPWRLAAALDPARIAALTADGLLSAGERIRATAAGRLLLDRVTAELLA